jgi:hypothetical protein
MKRSRMKRKIYLLRVPELVGLLKMDLLRSSMFVPKHMAAFCAACVYKDYLSHSKNLAI